MSKTPKSTFSLQNSHFRFEFFFDQNLDFVLGAPSDGESEAETSSGETIERIKWDRRFRSDEDGSRSLFDPIAVDRSRGRRVESDERDHEGSVGSAESNTEDMSEEWQDFLSSGGEDGLHQRRAVSFDQSTDFSRQRQRRRSMSLTEEAMTLTWPGTVRPIIRQPAKRSYTAKFGKRVAKRRKNIFLKGFAAKPTIHLEGRGDYTEFYKLVDPKEETSEDENKPQAVYEQATARPVTPVSPMSHMMAQMRTDSPRTSSPRHDGQSLRDSPRSSPSTPLASPRQPPPTVMSLRRRTSSSSSPPSTANRAPSSPARSPVSQRSPLPQRSPRPKLNQKKREAPKAKVRVRFGPHPTNLVRQEWEGDVVVQILEKKMDKRDFKKAAERLYDSNGARVAKGKKGKKAKPTPQFLLRITRTEDKRPWDDYGCVGNGLCWSHRRIFDYLIAPFSGEEIIYDLKHVSRAWQDGARKIELEFGDGYGYKWARVTFTLPERLGSGEISHTRFWSAIEEVSRRLKKHSMLENKIPPPVILEYVAREWYSQNLVLWVQRILTAYTMIAAVLEIYKIHSDFPDFFPWVGQTLYLPFQFAWWIFSLVFDLERGILGYPLERIIHFIGIRETFQDFLVFVEIMYLQVCSLLYYIISMPHNFLEFLDEQFGLPALLLVDVMRRQITRISDGLQPIWLAVRSLSAILFSMWMVFSGCVGTLFSPFSRMFASVARAGATVKKTGQEAGRLAVLASSLWTRGKHVVTRLFNPIYMFFVRLCKLKDWFYVWAANLLGLGHGENPTRTVRDWFLKWWWKSYAAVRKKRFPTIFKTVLSERVHNRIQIVRDSVCESVFRRSNSMWQWLMVFVICDPLIHLLIYFVIECVVRLGFVQLLPLVWLTNRTEYNMQ